MFCQLTFFWLFLVVANFCTSKSKLVLQTQNIKIILERREEKKTQSTISIWECRQKS